MFDAMLISMSSVLYDRVIKSHRIKHKFWGFFWRDTMFSVSIVIIFLALAIIILALLNKEIGNVSMPMLMLAGAGALGVCMVFTVIKYKLNKADAAEK